jgi:hypothetical protein
MEQLSTTARDQPIWSERASQSSSAKCIRSQTPARCQSRRRRQHVIPDPHPSSCGSICQGMPLRRTKTMPVRHARSETRGRPPCGRRGRIGKKGSTRSHNRSGSNAAAIRRSRYFANEDQVRDVLLRPLSVLRVSERVSFSPRFAVRPGRRPQLCGSRTEHQRPSTSTAV